MKTKWKIGLVVALAVASGVEVNGGTILTMEFEGIVNNVTWGGPPEFPKIDDLVVGTIAYDLGTPDTDPVWDSGEYVQSIPGGFSTLVGSMLFEYSDYRLIVRNQGPAGADGFTVNSGGSIPWIALGVWAIGNGDIVDDVDLPTSFDLAELGIPTDTAGVVFGPDDIWRIDFTLTQVFVPEPATLSLLALGGLVALRRRRR